MSILAWIILGGLAGWLASLVMGENDRLGWFGNIIVGIAGAFIGSWIAGFLGVGEDGIDFDLGTLGLSVLGACILLFLVQIFTRKRGV